MAKVSTTPPLLGPLHQLYISPSDPVLTQVIIFYLPYSGTSSRIDAHVFSACGFASYPRMTIDPSSNLYAAVNYLPTAQKESEAHRALAFVLCKYFSELSSRVKTHCLTMVKINSLTAIPFDAYHAAEITSRLTKFESDTAIPSIVASMRERYLNSLDFDLVLGTSGSLPTAQFHKQLSEIFGEITPLSTTKLKRSNSRSNRARAKSVILPTPNPDIVDQQVHELLATERSYVDKISGFYEDLIKPERARSAKNPEREPTLATLNQLFPRCLDNIFELNAAFLADLESAIHAGVESVAKVCLNHFPGFRDSYREYIELNPAFSGWLPKLMKGKNTFSKRIESTGEQRLRSLMIEPVQRLPRYSLLVDALINNLPLDSPAVADLMLCRDIITDICEMEAEPITERSQIASRLSSLIATWPSGLKPTGRVVIGVDFLDIVHPFSDSCEQIPSIMLLFADGIAFLRRLKPTSLKAQGVMAELDRPQAMTGSASKRDVSDLQFAGWIALSDVRFSESDKGRAVWVILEKELCDFWDNRMGTIGTRKFWLCSAWEGKATQLIEDILQLRIAAKSSKVNELRYISRDVGMHGIDLWTSIYNITEFQREKMKSKIVFCTRECAPHIENDTSAEILVIIHGTDIGKLRVEIKSLGKTLSVDTVGETDFLAVTVRRLSSILEKHNQPSHPPVTAALIETNKRVIQSLQLGVQETESRFKSFRPPSPVKIISNILGGGSPSPVKPLPREKSIFDNAPILSPPRVLERSHSVVYKSEAAEEDLESRLQRITIVEGWGGEEETYHRKLERTLQAFVVTLQAGFESPNFDINNVLDRGGLSQASVTELVNSLLREPKNLAPALMAPLNVLFVGFELFLRNAWQDSMGSLLSKNTLKDMQVKFATLYPGDFEDYFKNVLSEMTPQNKRAFKAIVLLIAKLAESIPTRTREIVLRTFAELVVKSGYQKGNVDVAERVVEFVPLLDYIVDECENLFGDSPSSPARETEGSFDSNASVRRAKTVATSTISSNSSIKRRFGIPIGSSDLGSKPSAASVWRTLSKKGEKDRPVSPPKTPNLSRSRSIDQDSRSDTHKRPMSRDRPMVNGLNGVPHHSRTEDADSVILAPIVGSPAAGTPSRGQFSTPTHPRRKRRSSLSDLVTNTSSPKSLFPSPRVSPDRPVRSGLPKSQEPLRAVDRKENKFASPSGLPVAVARDSPSQKPLRRLERHRSALEPVTPSNTDIIAPLNIVKSESKETKARVQSSTKLRERLNGEKKDITTSEKILVDDFSRLGEELAQIRIGPRGSKTTTTTSNIPTSATTSTSLVDDDAKRLASRLSKLETQTTSTIIDLTKKYEHLDSTFQAFMVKKEQEVKGLDKLYQDVNEENDVLFERFNDELTKVAAALRASSGDSELINLLRKTREQEGSLRAENARLKRENLALKYGVQ